MSTVDFYYDIASPNCYMANRALPGILERHGAEVNYVPILLGGIFKSTNNQAPFVAFGEIPLKLNYMQVEMQRFTRRYGLDKFKMNPHFPLNTLPIMRGAVAAQQQGILPQYIEAAEVLVWEEGVNLPDPEVFVAGFTAQGLDGAALLEATQDPAVKQGLIDNTNAAVERGVFGLPTLFLGDELFFGKDSLDDLNWLLGQGA